MQRTWFQEFLTVSLGMIQECHVGRVELEGKLVLLWDLTQELQCWNVKKVKILILNAEQTVSFSSVNL